MVPDIMFERTGLLLKFSQTWKIEFRRHKAPVNHWREVTAEDRSRLCARKPINVVSWCAKQRIYERIKCMRWVPGYLNI